LIAPTDRGFTLGDGLFETVLAVEGRMDHLAAHAARMIAGCAALGLPSPDLDHLTAAIPELGPGRQAVRITWSAGTGGRGLDRPDIVTPVLTVTAALAPLPGPARLVTSRIVRRNEQSPAANLKTLAYLDNVLARREALAAGGDEAVMLNTRGQLACAAAANLFWIKDGRIFTPALACGALPGLARARLMAAVDVQEVVAGPEALDGAEAVFVTNSLTGVRQVARLDGRDLAPHPLAAGLSA
jgi:branched-subunit amino acid aminotransferase/4-amino-4-deoxychorismate lyase